MYIVLKTRPIIETIPYMGPEPTGLYYRDSTVHPILFILLYFQHILMFSDLFLLSFSTIPKKNVRDSVQFESESTMIRKKCVTKI